MTTRKQTPILVRSGATGSVYIVTKYRDHGNGNIEALEKHEVTQQYNTLWKADLARISERISQPLI